MLCVVPLLLGDTLHSIFSMVCRSRSTSCPSPWLRVALTGLVLLSLASARSAPRWLALAPGRLALFMCPAALSWPRPTLACLALVPFCSLYPPLAPRPLALIGFMPLSQASCRSRLGCFVGMLWRQYKAPVSKNLADGRQSRLTARVQSKNSTYILEN